MAKEPTKAEIEAQQKRAALAEHAETAPPPIEGGVYQRTKGGELRQVQSDDSLAPPAPSPETTSKKGS